MITTVEKITLSRFHAYNDHDYDASRNKNMYINVKIRLNEM